MHPPEPLESWPNAVALHHQMQHEAALWRAAYRAVCVLPAEEALAVVRELAKDYWKAPLAPYLSEYLGAGAPLAVTGARDGIPESIYRAPPWVLHHAPSAKLIQEPAGEVGAKGSVPLSDSPPDSKARSHTQLLDLSPEKEQLALLESGGDTTRKSGSIVKAGASKISTVLPVSMAVLRERAAKVEEHSARERKANAERRDAAELVFRYWASVLHHDRAVLDDKRRKKIEARLKENGDDVSELLYCVDGAKRDAWIMGKDPKSPRAYTGIETVFRDRAQVERLASNIIGYRKKEPHPLLREES